MVEQVAAPGQHTSVDPRVESRLAMGGRVFRWLAVIYSVLAVVGTALDAARDFPPGPSLLRDIPFASAISLTTLAVGALLAGDISHTIGGKVAIRRVGVALALAAAVFGGFIVYGYFAETNEMWGEVTEIPAFSVGIILIILGLSVPVSVSRVEWRVIAGQIGSLLVFSITAGIFLGYMYGDPSVGLLFVGPAISFQASIIAVLIATGILLFRPASGLLSTASSPGPGGRMLRWVGPLVLLMPALLLLTTELVPDSERIDVLAFASVGLGLFLLILLSFFVRALDQTAIAAATRAAEAERAKTGLEQEAPVVSGMADMFHLVDLASIEGWDVATRFRPGRGSVAGDSSAVRLLPDGSIGAVLVDLTGHGADPAIWAIRMRDLMIQTLVAGRSPSETLALVEWSVPDDLLASALVIKVEPLTGHVVMCSAGHPPAIVVSTQDATLMSPTGPLLYLAHSDLYESHEFDLHEGDALVAFSDGVADVQRQRGGRTQPEILADRLIAEGGDASRTADLVLGFAEYQPSDDQTVVVIRRR
jgi:hypothetical protein